MKKITAMLLVVLTLMSGLSINHTSAKTHEERQANVKEIITKTATSTDSCNEFEIEFDLNGIDEVSKEMDIVLVLDKSSSEKFTGLQGAFSSFLNEMLEIEGVQFNVGVIVFYNQVIAETDGLVPLNESTVDDLVDTIKQYNESGTNLHGGLELANEWLDADQGKPASQKHVIVFSDFGGYLMNDDEGYGLMRYYYYDSSIHKGSVIDEVDVKYSDSSQIFTEEGINKLINEETTLDNKPAILNQLTESGSHLGEYRYADSSTITTQTQTQAFIDTLLTGYNVLRTDGFPTMLEKGIYAAGNILQDMKEKGYNINTVTAPYASGNSNKIAEAFKSWISQEIGTRYEKSEWDDIHEIFDNIVTGIVEALDHGVITDEIADEFNVISQTEEVVLNGVALVSRENNGKTEFVKADQPNEVIATYHYDLLTHTVTWEVFETLHVNDHITLTFEVSFNESYLENLHSNLIATNKEAILSYQVSNSAETHTVLMESPMVTINENCNPVPVVEGTVIIRHITEDGRELTEEVSTTRPVGESYTSEVGTFEGYEFMKMLDGSAATSGEYIEGVQIVTYVYRLKTVIPVTKEGTVIIRHITEDGRELTEEVSTTRPVGEAYTSEVRTFEGYEFVKMLDGSAATSGEYIEGIQIVTYVYRPIIERPVLPNTGVSSSIGYALFAITTGSLIVLLARKRASQK